MNDAVIKRNRSALASAPIGPSLWDALKKLDPRVQRRNPVMLVVLVGTLLTFALGVAPGRATHASASPWQWPPFCWPPWCSLTLPNPSLKPAVAGRPPACVQRAAS